MLVKILDYGPYSKEIDMHGGTKGLLESGSKLEPGFVTALVEGVGKGDLLIIISWQQAYLVSGKVGREIKFWIVLLGPVLEWERLPCGVARPRHVRYRRHERILIRYRQLSRAYSASLAFTKRGT